MKKILISVGIIGVVAAAIIGGTVAYFSDTETSTGNTFTAGSIDLKIDSESHFNNMVCTGNPGVWQAGPGEPFNGDNDRVPSSHYPQPGTSCGGTWTETDLGASNHQFFNFSDLKPGDFGENTISLHVYDNDAWLQYKSDNMVELETGSGGYGTGGQCNEAEFESGDDTCGTGNDQGELGESLDWHVWLDQGSIPGFQNIDANGDPIYVSDINDLPDPTEGDNIQNSTIEFTVLGGDDEIPSAGGGGDILWPFIPGTQYFFAESLIAAYRLGDGIKPCLDLNTSPDGHNNYDKCQGLAEDGRIVGSTTYYFGTAWCLGTFVDTLVAGPSVGAPSSCDGSTVSNMAQSDSFIADNIYEVVQHRNNPNQVF